MAVLSPAEVYALAQRHFGDLGPQVVAEMAATALAESGGRTDAHNDRGEDSRGPWQINVGPGANTDLAGMDLFDPDQNAAAARIVYDRAGPDAWTTHAQGLHERYLPTVQQAGGQSPEAITMTTDNSTQMLQGYLIPYLAAQIAQMGAGNEQALSALSGYLDPATLGGQAGGIPTLAREMYEEQTRQARDNYALDVARFGLDQANLNFQQRTAAANTRLNELALLASQRGPENAISYNYLLNNLDAPEGRTTDADSVSAGINQPSAIQMPQATPAPERPAQGIGTPAAVIPQQTQQPKPAPAPKPAPTQAPTPAQVPQPTATTFPQGAQTAPILYTDGQFDLDADSNAAQAVASGQTSLADLSAQLRDTIARQNEANAAKRAAAAPEAQPPAPAIQMPAAASAPPPAAAAPPPVATPAPVPTVAAKPAPVAAPPPTPAQVAQPSAGGFDLGSHQGANLADLTAQYRAMVAAQEAANRAKRGLPAMAGGGATGGMAVVGERGPELAVNLPGDGFAVLNEEQLGMDPMDLPSTPNRGADDTKGADDGALRALGRMLMTALGRRVGDGTERAADGGFFGETGNVIYSPEQIAGMPTVQKFTGGQEAAPFGTTRLNMQIPGTDTSLPMGHHANVRTYNALAPSERQTLQSVIETPRQQGGLGLIFGDWLHSAMQAAPTGRSFGPAGYGG